jgi:uncharacterized protein YggU (UPF0235/DUF167 family)
MSRNFEITSAKGGAAFTVRVVTRAETTELAGLLEDGVVRVRLIAKDAAEPAANSELIDFIAGLLKVPAKKVEIVAGHTQRDKILCVMDLGSDELEQILGKG